MKKKWDVYIYGDVNIDLVISGVEALPLPGQEYVVEQIQTYVGGGAALFTLGLGKLGLRPVFQGKVGADFYGRFIREEFNKRNVDDSLLTVSETDETGISISFTNEQDRAFITSRGTNEKLDVSAVDLAMVRQAGHLHVTGYSGRTHNEYHRLLKQVKDCGEITVSFDLGWDDSGEWYEGIYELFPYIDVLFMNETEALHYSRKDHVTDAMLDFGEFCELVVIKCGKKGAMSLHQGKISTMKAFPVTAVDSTGAGDSFNAGFIYGYLSGMRIEDCLSCGNGCGALNVTAYGGNTGFPDRTQLEEFLSRNHSGLGMEETER